MCVDKLIFYFYRYKTSLYTHFQQAWEQLFLEKIYTELQSYINGNERISNTDLQSTHWETYFRLILFSARSFSTKHIKISPLRENLAEQQRFYFKLEQLTDFARAQLQRPQCLTIHYRPLPSDIWKIDSRFSVFDEHASQQPPLFNPVPSLAYNADNFMLIMSQTLNYARQMQWEEQEQLINANYALELFLKCLPLLNTADWAGFIAIIKPQQQIDIILQHVTELIRYYYRLQNALFSSPSPEQYAKQIIIIFSTFCFLDGLLKTNPAFSFIDKYVPALAHLADQSINLRALAPYLVVTAPRFAKQLQAILVYLEQQEKKHKIILNFEYKKELSSKWSLAINENVKLPDIELLGDCISFGNKQQLFDDRYHHLAYAHRIVYGLIDEKHEFMPTEVHCWRECALYCRLTLSGFLIDDKLLPEDVWELTPISIQKNAELLLKLNGFKNFNVVLWHQYSANSVQDPAIRFLCDKPPAELKENEILTQVMPETKILSRRFFNQFAELHISLHLQIFSVLELACQNMHRLQEREIRLLLEKYLFETGSKVNVVGSILMKTCHDHTQVKPLLLNFMNLAEYYYAGQLNRIHTYLELIHLFLAIERFLLLYDNSQLVCHTIFDKLYKILTTQDKYHAEIAGTLIMLFQNYSKCPANHASDIHVIERVTHCWAYLLRAKYQQENLPVKYYIGSKNVLLSLQERFLTLLDSNKDIRNLLMNSFLKILLTNNSNIQLEWEQISRGCLNGGYYYVNLFDAKIYYKGFPLGTIPDEILAHDDYKKIFHQKSLCIELERATQSIQVYRTLGHTNSILTAYRHQNVDHNAPIQTRSSYGYQLRCYGEGQYPQVVCSDQIHQSYFSPMLYSIKMESHQKRMASLAIKEQSNLDIIIHEELNIADHKLWGQFLPTWRLEGLLPAFLLDGYTHWLACSPPPKGNFIQLDQAVFIELSDTANKQTIMFIDTKKQMRYIGYFFPGNKIQLFKLNDYGVAEGQWIDILRLESSSPFIPFCQILFRFELPTYISAWRHRNGNIIFELPRYRLNFLYHEQTKSFSALDFDDYFLTEEISPVLNNVSYFLVLNNKFDEKIILFPHLGNIRRGLLEDDPLNTQIYSDLKQVGIPAYFAYRYANQLQELESNSILAGQYLILLFVLSRDYISAYEAMQNCWQDELLATDQWQMMMRFFDETEKDPHPDNHALRLQYLLLYSPVYKLLNERNIAKDKLTEIEQQQLTAYQKLFEKCLEDLTKYFAKWIYVACQLRLTEDQEKLIFATGEKFGLKFNQMLINRRIVLNQPNECILFVPSYSQNQDIDELFYIKNFDVNQADFINNYFSLSSKPIDFFGFYQEHPTTFSQSFLYLYRAYCESKLTAYDLIFIIRSIAWSNRLSGWQTIEYGLFQCLRHIAQTPNNLLPKLPHTIQGDKTINFHCINSEYNFIQEAKDFSTWFLNLLKFLYGRNISLVSLQTASIKVNIFSIQCKLNPFKAIPNTIPERKKEVKFSPKFPIMYDLDKFKDQFKFDPNQPLGQIFQQYFLRNEERLPQRQFPLSIAPNDTSEYVKLIQDNALAREIYDYFNKDFDFFQAQPVEQFSLSKGPESLVHLENKLVALAKTLRNDIDLFNAHLISIANKNLCRRQDVFDSTNEMHINGLQVKYAQLAQQVNRVKLKDLLSSLLSQSLLAYHDLNPFLLQQNITELMNTTLDYLILSNTLYLVKRVLIYLSELKEVQQDNEKQNIIKQIGRLCYQKRFYVITENIPYIMFEYLHGCLLWDYQISALAELKPLSRKVAITVPLGGGKSSTIAPLLGQYLSDGHQLVTFAIIHSLIAQFIQIMRQRYRGPLAKHIHTLSWQRSTLFTPNIVSIYHEKLRNVIRHKDILVYTPDIPNCFLLKWAELAKEVYSGKRDISEVLDNAEAILCMLGTKTSQIIDEYEFVLNPLRSELNFTEGQATTLQPAPLRWQYAQYLLLTAIHHPQLKETLRFAIDQQDFKSHDKHPVFQFGMLELVNPNYYKQVYKRCLAKEILQELSKESAEVRTHHLIFGAYLLADPCFWEGDIAYLPLDFYQMLQKSKCIDETNKQLRDNLHQILYQNSSSAKANQVEYYQIKNKRLYLSVIHPMLAVLLVIHVHDLLKKDELSAHKLIMAKEWLNTILPHVLQMRLNIQFGRYFDKIQDLNKNIKKIYYANRKLVVPYTGKDNPNKRAEYQNPDIVIALTCLCYFYSGLLEEEFNELISHLQDEMEREGATPLYHRRAVVLFRQWQKEAKLPHPIELHQLDLSQTSLATSLYQALRQYIPLVSYYLDHLVFPPHLKVFLEKMYSNGYDLASMLIDVTKGFSATIEHSRLILPENISIRSKQGIDGMMLYVLSQDNNQKVYLVDFNDDKELLSKIDLKWVRMFADPEGFIQSMNNREVATFLLIRAPNHIQGTIYIDDVTKKIVVLIRSGEMISITECNIPPRLLLKYIDHDSCEGTDVPQALSDIGIMTSGPKTNLRRTFQSRRRLRFLDLYCNQSVCTLMRTSDAKQVWQLLNLPKGSELNSIHNLRWTFAHTISSLTEEFQVTPYQRMHAVIRSRAYHLLLGKYTYERLPQYLDEEIRTKLWQALHDLNILDEYDRVRHEVKVQQLQGLSYITPDMQKELQLTLTNLYRYRKKQNGLDTVRLCLDAFSEKINYMLTQMIPLDVCADTTEVIGQACRQLKLYYGGILLEVDNKALDTIADQAKQFLPKWTVSRQLSREVEKESQESIHFAVYARSQKEQESEKEKQQQQEKVSHSQRLFKPVPQVFWNYQQIINSSIQQMTIPLNQSGLAEKQLRFYLIYHVFGLPFSRHILMTENFIKTAENTKVLEQFAKNIQYYLEIQEVDHTWYIILDMHEAEYIKICLNNKLLDTKAIGIRTLSGMLISCTPLFKLTEVPEMLHVQLLFLNGATENEIPSRLTNTWRIWKSQAGQDNSSRVSDQLKIALMK